MRRLVFALAAACAAPDPAAAAVDRIVVEKAARRMTLYDGAAAVATYRVALGFATVGDKRREGEGRTPEGVYRIDFKNPRARFHRSLRVSYPDATDSRAARRLGVAPGGDIFIHGTPGRRKPWPANARIPDCTLGCIAVTDGEIEEIYRRVGVGTRIEIRP